MDILGLQGLLAAVFVSWLLSGCTSEIVAGEESDTTTAIEPTPAFLSVISGNDQVGVGGDTLSDRVVVQLVDSTDSPIPNATINLDVVEGGGRILSDLSVVSDDSGMAEVVWEIGRSYNGLEFSLSSESYSAEPSYAWATGENPRGIDVTRTLSSLRRLGETAYFMTFVGDYGRILENENLLFVGNGQNVSTSSSDPIYCSLFSAFGNPEAALFGRSFDNPSGWRVLTLIAEYRPIDGYRSVALMRLRDIGFELGTQIEHLTFREKRALLRAAFHVPDGINEHGVVAGLASVRPGAIVPDPEKESIWITLLVRKILDGAQTVDEAVDIALQYNLVCPTRTSFGIHVLIADPSGHSVILELADGEIKVSRNTEEWQVITNSPSYGVSIREQKSSCRRFEIIYDRLEQNGGNITWRQAMQLLGQVSIPSTEWSAVYDMTNRSVTVAIDADFSRFHEFSIGN